MLSTNESFIALRREITARGWDRKAPGWVMFALWVNVILAVGGILIFVLSENLLLCACGLIVSTAGSMGIGTNTHTSSHYATSERRWLNELLTYFGLPFFLGISAHYWWYSHVVLHHPAPNVVGVDADSDLMPWFARTEKDVRQSRGLLRFYYEKVQWLVFPIALVANYFNTQVSGWRHLLSRLRRPARGRKPYCIDLGALLLHFVTTLAIPMYYFEPVDVVGFYLLRFGIISYAMFAILAPAHFPTEAVCIAKDLKNSDYFFLQAAATLNFRTGPIGRFLCSGLEYQIEHHLFPDVSHVYYPKISKLVKKFCREHGLPYRSYQWESILWKSWMMLRRASQVETSLEGMQTRMSAKPPATEASLAQYSGTGVA